MVLVLLKRVRTEIQSELGILGLRHPCRAPQREYRSGADQHQQEQADDDQDVVVDKGKEGAAAMGWAVFLAGLFMAELLGRLSGGHGLVSLWTEIQSKQSGVDESDVTEHVDLAGAAILLDGFRALTQGEGIEGLDALVLQRAFKGRHQPGGAADHGFEIGRASGRKRV